MTEQDGVKSDAGSDALDWDTYRETRTRFDEQRVSQINAFDKATLTISTSAIGFSVILLTALSTLKPVTDLKLLVMSWAAFAIVILANLISYLLGAAAFQKEIESLDDAMRTGDWAGQPSRFFNIATRTANLVAMFMMSSGIIALMRFAFLNAL